MGFKRSADYDDGANGAGGAQGRYQKKRRTYTEEDAKLAKIYDNLASEEDQVRVNAAIDLVHTSESLNDSEEDGSKHALDKIRVRLIKGLCSSRKGARIGFSLAFTEFLGVTLGLLSGESFHQGVKDLITVIKKQTKAEGGTRQEKRDHLIGRVFALNCIVRSKVLFKDKEHAQSLPTVIRELCELSKNSSSSWSKEECGLVCCQAVSLLIHELPSASEVARTMLETMQELGALKTPEGVIIWLELSKHMVNVSFPVQVWHKNNPLHAKEIATVAKILHAVKLSDDEDTKETSGARQVAPHFAWTIILQQVMAVPTKEKQKKNNKKKEGETLESGENKLFKQFWIEAVDNMFFAASASPEKKAVGFQVFDAFIATAPVSMLAQAFSVKLMNCLINQSANEKRYLHAVAKRLLDAIVVRAIADDDAAPVILAALIKDNGQLTFDKLTKSETVATIATKATKPAQLSILKVYETLITQQPSELKPQEVDARLNLIGDQLVALTRSYIKVQPSPPCGWTEWLDKTFQILGALGFAVEPNKYLHSELAHPLSLKAREGARAKFASCLANLLNATDPIDETTKQKCNANVAIREAASHFHKCNTLLRKIGVVTLSEADSQITDLCDEVYKLQETSSKREDKKKKDKKKKEAIANDDMNQEIKNNGNMHMDTINLLASMTLFQAYNGEADAINMLQEIADFHKTVVKDNATQTCIPADVMANIMEIILSFCSQSTALHKRVADLAFKGLSSAMTPEALHSMLEVLEQKEGLAGQQALFGDAAEEADGADSAEEDEEDDDDNASDDDSENEAEDFDHPDFEIVDVDEEDSDVELINGELVEHDNDDNEEDASSTTSTSSNSSDSSDIPDQELTDFEQKLASILNLPKSTHNDDDNDDAASTTTDSTMNSSQMAELDTHLSAVFRERSKASGGPISSTSTDKQATKAQTQRRAKENIIAFKNRVLDLLTDYLSAEVKGNGRGNGYKEPVALNCLLPLLRCLRGSRSAQIQARVSKVILEVYIGTAKKKRGWPSVDPSFGFDNNTSEDDDADDDANDDNDVDADADEDAETDTSKVNVWSLLAQTLTETTLFTSREHTKAGSRACLFLARCLLTSSSPSSIPSSEQVRSRIAQLYSAAHASALDKAGGANGKDNRKESDKKESKKTKQRASEGGKEGGDQSKVQLPDWQEAVWSDWAEFDRQTRKSGM